MRNIKNFFPVALIFVFLIFSSSIASANEITVGDNPDADFTSIQAAVNAASPGDIIIVKPGTYVEDISIEKNLTIISESGNSSNTVVKSAKGSDDIFRVLSNGVSIQGLSINGAEYAGIHIFGFSDCHIINNNLSNNGCGIDLYIFSSGNTLVYNQISDSVTGISLGDSMLNSLSNNSVSNCTNAISLFDSRNNILKNNLISNNIEGVSLIGESNSNNLTGNIINSNNGTGMHLYGAYDNLIYNNYFNNTANVEFDEFDSALGANIWNINKTAGTNIVGDPYIGGNFWAKPDRTAYSQISSDSDRDGIGDLRYNISENEFDYLPLVSLSIPEKPVFPVINESGMNSSFDIIIVQDPSGLPEAEFDANPIIGNAPLTVYFTDHSKNATGWYWDFDDGNTSIDKNPVNIFSKSGKYAVNLTVTNENGTSSKTKEITVNKALTEEKIYPVADFDAYPTSGNAPLSVRFTDRSQNATGWHWDFDDGNTSTDKNPVNFFSKAGKYTVNLTLTNENGTNSKALDINVNEASNEEEVIPEADFAADPTLGNAPLTVQFNDLSKNATGWNWDFDDGNTSTARNLVHTYYTAGRYTVNLTVTNENGSNSKTTEIAVSETPIDEDILPVADFNAYPGSGNAPLSVQFTDHSQNATARSWDFNNDGITDNNSEAPVYVYTVPGVYTVNLTVNNANGMNSKTMTITVNEADNEEKILPEADFSAVPASGTAPLSVQFIDLSKNATGWNWNFNDGSTSTAENLTHTFYTAGRYTVNLTVTNENGSNSKTLEIAVNAVLIEEKVLPVANFAVYPTSGNAPLSVQFTDLSQNAVSRSWDFNNDGTADSEDTSPVYTYTASGTYTANLTVSNSNGTANKSAIINVLDGSSGGSSSGDSSSGGSSSGSSSSGGSGGGAGGSPELQSNVEAKELSQTFISSGSSARFDFPRNATSVRYITFNSKKTAGKTTTIVEMLKGKSSLVSQLPSAEVYKSLNIWVGNSGFATTSNIENSVICFKVEKSWMRDKNVSQSSIILQRYSENKWNSLPTSLLGEDGNYYYFTAQTPGFSPFTITGGTLAKEIVSKTQPAADTKIQPGANVVNAVQNNTAPKTVQASGLTSEQKSEKGKSSNLPVFAMICMIALFLVTFLFRLDKK